MHSPVTQDTVVSQGEITPAESRGWGRKRFLGGKQNGSKRASVETSLTNREDGETAVAGGEFILSFYFFPIFISGEALWDEYSKLTTNVI